MKYFIICACVLHAALAAPQLITFKDGKVGVNFLGYHAEAGLGGNQNGDGLLGGLHASAGTPFGQNAAAGLGGNVNGRAGGLLYAGAQASPDVGAGAALGGDTATGGFRSAEAYVPGKRTATSHRTLFSSLNMNDALHPTEPVTENNAIQKIKPPKKYHANDGIDDFEQYHDGKEAGSLPQPQLRPSSSLNVDSKTISKTIAKSVHISKAAPNTSLTPPAPAPTPSPSTSSSSPSLSNAGDNPSNYPYQDAIEPIAADESYLSSIFPSTLAFATADNYNENLNGNTAVLIHQSYDGKTKLRHRPVHPHRLRHQQRKLLKRINSQPQIQRSKSIVRTVERQQQQIAPPLPQQQQYGAPHLELPSEQDTLPQSPAQQEVNKPHERRHLIAPVQPPKSENVDKEQRTNPVFNALQIPVGILQSLQESLGRF